MKDKKKHHIWKSLSKSESVCEICGLKRVVTVDTVDKNSSKYFATTVYEFGDNIFKKAPECNKNILIDKAIHAYSIKIGMLKKLKSTNDMNEIISKHLEPLSLTQEQSKFVNDLDLEYVECIHIKTGNKYFAHRLVLNCTNENDGQVMVVYSNQKDKKTIFVRELIEFLTKFKPVSDETQCK